MLSSSEATESFDKMKRGIDMGAGAVVAKSYCSEPEIRRQTDLSKYCVLGYDRKPVYGRDVPKLFTLYSRCGTIQASEDEWFEELAKTQEYASKFDAHVIGSIYGHKDSSEYARLAKRMEQIGLRMLEIDLGCPIHPAAMQGEEVTPKPDKEYNTAKTLANTTKVLVEATSIPIIIKLSPQQVDLAASALAVKEAGAAGVTCHNRFLGFAIDIENAKPYIWGWAGVGGPWMLPISLRWVSKLYETDPNFPIFGSSGPYDWSDVVRFLMAGATAVEFCTTVMFKGYSVIKDSIEGLNSFLDTKGYKSVQDIMGVATRAALNFEQMYALPEYKEMASVDENKCIECGKCLDACWYTAMERIDGVYKVNESRCKGCYSCKIICPVENCIAMKTVGW